MNALSATARSAAAALLVLLLVVRMLSPAGFMPAFDHGTVPIVPCPDYEPVASPTAHQHHHGGGKKDHQPCPYAAGAAAGTVADFVLLSAALSFAAVLPIGRTFDSLAEHRDRERPPLRGPPLAA